jgi:hypothetical protein
MLLEDVVEREAIKALRDVGGDVEWWIFSGARIGHLRVPVIDAEFDLLPPGLAVSDAGESGPQRPRTTGA